MTLSCSEGYEILIERFLYYASAINKFVWCIIFFDKLWLFGSSFVENNFLREKTKSIRRLMECWWRMQTLLRVAVGHFNGWPFRTLSDDFALPSEKKQKIKCRHSSGARSDDSPKWWARIDISNEPFRSPNLSDRESITKMVVTFSNF